MIFYSQILKPSLRLAPLYPSDQDAINKLKQGVDYKFEVTAPRNYEFHKKHFALLNLGYANQDTYETFEEYRAIMTMRAGFFKIIATPKGRVYLPDSISFASMDDLKFAELYNKTIDLLCADLDTSKKEIEVQLMSFM